MFSQQNSISIKSKLDTEKDELKIQQEIVFHNPSDSILTKVYLHNWANSYRDRKTPLSKRFIKDFRKDLYFAKPQELGSSTIKSLSVDFENVYFKELDKQADIIEIDLDKPLHPNSKITISITYIVKTPSARFTKYGKTKTGYHLRNWYLTPAIYDNGWQLMSNLNLDDLYEKGTDFKIEIDVPKDLIVESNLYQYKTKKENTNSYYLVGKNKTDVILGINKTKQLKTYNTKTVTVHTDVFSKELDYNLTTSILNREILFIQKW